MKGGMPLGMRTERDPDMHSPGSALAFDALAPARRAGQSDAYSQRRRRSGEDKTVREQQANTASYERAERSRAEWAVRKIPDPRAATTAISSSSSAPGGPS